MKNLILPPLHVPTSFLKEGQRLYYLAGPKCDMDIWQTDAINLLLELDPGCLIACPLQYTDKHLLFSKIITKDDAGQVGNTFIDFVSEHEWSRYYMEGASYFGSVIFWLPTKSGVQCTGDAKKIAGVHRLLAEWIVKGANPDFFSSINFSKRVNVVIGADKWFPGIDSISELIDAEAGKDTPMLVEQSMENLIKKAVYIACGSQSPYRF